MRKFKNNHKNSGSNYLENIYHSQKALGLAGTETDIAVFKN